MSTPDRGRELLDPARRTRDAGSAGGERAAPVEAPLSTASFAVTDPAENKSRPQPGTEGRSRADAAVPSTPTARIGLVLHPTHDVMAVAERIVRWATCHGSEVLIRSRDADRCPGTVRAVSAAELTSQVNAILSLGGDGTMLGALRLVAARPVPVLGVNLGHLGFLVEVGAGELDAALDRLERREFTIEEHSAAVLRDDGEEVIAFNDVALTRVPGDGPVQATLTVAERPGGRYRCDSILFSTPIVSTAYSYAAGGPIISPALEAILVTPVAPITGIARPMVMSADEPVGIELLAESGAPALEIDGNVRRQARPGDTLAFALRPRAGMVVRFDPERYQRRNQVKLSLLDLPYLPDELRDLVPGAQPIT